MDELGSATPRELAARPGVRSALAGASPDLVAALDRAGDGPWDEKLEAAVARYLLRMAGRPTPFGLLATVSTGRCAGRTHLEVAADVSAHARRAIAVASPTGEPVANPTVHRVRDRLHYVEPAGEQWSAVGWSLELEQALRTRGEADGELLEAGLLTQPGPPVTGPAQTPVAGEPVHVDALRRAPGLALGPAVVDELAAAARLLCGLTRDAQPPAIAHFARRFTERYGDVEVPLLEALDPEAGLGLEEPEPDAAWSQREQRMLDAVSRGEPEWVLEDDDVRALAPAAPRPLPPAFAVLASLAAGSAQAADAGDFALRVAGVSGPSGARLVARHALADSLLRERLEAHLRAEEALDPDAVHAEVVHAGRDADLVARPVLREHEIVVSGRGGGRAIQPADLTVSICDGRPVLRSRALGRRVVPRLSSAHAFRRSAHSVYRFLGLLQDPHGEGWVAWDWGLLRTAQRLPRVTRGRLVLAPAAWRVPATALADPRALRERHGVPRWVALAEGGRELPLDLEGRMAAPVLARLARRGGAVELTEAWPVPDLLPVRSARGRHVHDLVVPFTAAPVPPPRAGARVARGRATFPPGSEWTSVKLYCGAAAADSLLVEAVAPLAARLMASGRADRWHFVRYADPEWHLRVRFHGDPGLAAEALALGRDPRVWRLVLDTYVREASRYGDPEAAERAFHADSDAAIALIASQPGPDRRLLALAGVASLLDDAAAGPGVALSMRAAFVAEQGVTSRELGAALRRDRAAIDAVLAERPAALAARSARWRADVAGSLSSPPALAGLAHLHVNRVLRDGHRREEAFIYDALARLGSRRAAPAR